MLIKFKQLIIAMFVCFFTIGFSQDLVSNIQSLLEDNAKGYLQPVVSTFGSGLNSGTFSSAMTHKFLGFDFTINGAYIPVPDKDLTFQFNVPQLSIPFTYGGMNLNLNLDGDMLYPGDRTVSTFFGSKSSTSFEPDEDYITSVLENQHGVPHSAAQAISSDMSDELILESPGGVDFTTMGALIPQVSVGLPLDIDVMARALPETEIGDLGKVSMIGFGGKIGLNQFVPFNIGLLPRLSAGYYMTNVSIGDIIDMTNTMTNLQASKKLLFLTVYGGFGIESSSVDVDYTTDEDVNVKFSLDGKNESRITAGARMKMLFFTLQADYSSGDYDSYNVGLSFTFR